jgi:hypothetical protein
VQEIKISIKQKSEVKISASTIQVLGYKFLKYLGRLHRHSLPAIRHQMALAGGYILHLDSTCEEKDPLLLSCVDGLSGQVWYSKKIRSENKADTIFCVMWAKTFWAMITMRYVVRSVKSKSKRCCAGSPKISSRNLVAPKRLQPFQTTYYLNGYCIIERELAKQGIESQAFLLHTADRKLPVFNFTMNGLFDAWKLYCMPAAVFQFGERESCMITSCNISGLSRANTHLIS